MHPAIDHRWSAGPLPGEGVSDFGLATIVAAFCLVIAASRISGRSQPAPCAILLSWKSPAVETAATPQSDSPSNPRRSYSVGQLALTAGMAVVSLTRWLHVMRISGARTY